MMASLCVRLLSNPRRLARAEIRHVRLALGVHQNVAGFEVAMQDAATTARLCPSTSLMLK